MTANGRDIVELFGYAADDSTANSTAQFNSKVCPFVDAPCSKSNHDKSVVYGTCSVTNGKKRGGSNDVIICPKRLYQNNYKIFQDVVDDAWGPGHKLVIGGSLSDLKKNASQISSPAIAFGQGSGNEIGVNSNGQLSMDWVIQKYGHDMFIEGLVPQEFVGIEVQSIDITGNYRDNWLAYSSLRTNQPSISQIPLSGHGLNWANVHKRLIPQIIRKGNLYKRIDRCSGFYFLVPEAVFLKFEEVIGKIPEESGPSRNNISIRTYSLSAPTAPGSIRYLDLTRSAHYKLEEVAQAFISNVDPKAIGRLDQTLKNIL